MMTEAESFSEVLYFCKQNMNDENIGLCESLITHFCRKPLNVSDVCI
jgi:hypothetical protein